MPLFLPMPVPYGIIFYRLILYLNFIVDVEIIEALVGYLAILTLYDVGSQTNV